MFCRFYFQFHDEGLTSNRRTNHGLSIDGLQLRMLRESWDFKWCESSCRCKSWSKISFLMLRITSTTSQRRV
ncbi:hypothetical protein MKW98_026506 [Papaver atlanticum]|uniref:Uncharacterized protein n=1 Tax=Papaver atlanticum TaxID=357466 RepID=A0AAD4TCD4_9MAGN|nr:hypothetical protein MKW98_026506 [Papaver atlanticum]